MGLMGSAGGPCTGILTFLTLLSHQPWEPQVPHYSDKNKFIFYDCIFTSKKYSAFVLFQHINNISDAVVIRDIFLEVR